MEKTVEQDSRLVRISNDYVDFMEDRKTRFGSTRSQVEYFLRNNPEFKKAFNSFVDREGGDKI